VAARGVRVARRVLGEALMRSMILVIAFATACKSSKDDTPPPQQPASGAPVVFQVTKLAPAAPGERHSGKAELRMYNFSEKTTAQYAVLVRYRDASGSLIKLGTADFPRDVENLSFGGQGVACDPKSWCSFALHTLDAPPNAASAEMVPDRVQAVKDGSFEDKPFYELAAHAWPSS
jgi:hypothetical protein